MIPKMYPKIGSLKNVSYNKFPNIRSLKEALCETRMLQWVTGVTRLDKLDHISGTVNEKKRQY